MAATAQARITDSSRDRLVRLTRQTGKSQQEVIDAALEGYERELFLTRVNEGYAELRTNTEAWEEFQAEFEEWDVTLGDGVA